MNIYRITAGERLIQYATENLVTEVLIYPQSNTLLQCIRNLLASFTKHRHIIHAGYTFGGNGSWILQVCYTYKCLVDQVNALLLTYCISSSTGWNLQPG